MRLLLTLCLFFGLISQAHAERYSVGQVAKWTKQWEILQMTGEKSALCTAHDISEGTGVVGNSVVPTFSSESYTVYVTGFSSLENATDGSNFVPGIFKVTGTYEYQSRSGKRTVQKIEPATQKELDAYNAPPTLEEQRDSLLGRINATKAKGEEPTPGDVKILESLEEQIKKKNEEGSASPVMRTWKTSDYKFSVEAKYVGYEKGTVELVGKDGKQMFVPISKLRMTDQRYVRAKIKHSKNLKK